MSKATVLRGSAARARDKHHTKCTGHSTTPCNKLVNRTCSYRVLLYIPKVISLSGWLLRDDASTFQYYFSKPVSMELNNRKVPIFICGATSTSKKKKKNAYYSMWGP